MFPTHVIPEDAEQEKVRLTTPASLKLNSQSLPLAFMLTRAPNMSFGISIWSQTKKHTDRSVDPPPPPTATRVTHLPTFSEGESQMGSNS